MNTTLTYPDVHTYFKKEFYNTAKEELPPRTGMVVIFDLAAERFEAQHGFSYPNTYWAFLKRHYKKKARNDKTLALDVSFCHRTLYTANP